MSTDLPIGTILSERWRLDAHARDGAVVASYRATDLTTDGVVALHVLHGRWAREPAELSRFAEATRLARALEHPCVAEVVAAARSGERWYATTHTPGIPLDTGISEQVLPAGLALRAVFDAAHGLAHAHRRGVRHGALTPASIVVRSDGSSTLFDFGLVPPDPRQLGTMYLAPEAADGERIAASDVYSLGMTVLFALRGGRLPFSVLRDAEPVLRALEVAEPVRDAVRAAINWDADARPSAAAFAADLRADPDIARALERSGWSAEEASSEADSVELPGSDPALGALLYDDDGVTRALVLRDAEIAIGRGRNNRIQLANDAHASRIHCSVVRVGDVYQIVDYGSSHGTRVNNREVSEKRLVPGDRIRVGDTVFVFRLARPEDDLLPPPISGEDEHTTPNPAAAARPGGVTRSDR